MAQRLKLLLKDAFQGASEPGTAPARVAGHSMARPEGERRYLVGTSSRPHAGKRPLVLVLHGGGASARQVLGMAFPATPLSALVFGGTKDRLVPYRGGRFFYVPLAPVNGIEDSVAMWREHNALPETPLVEALSRSDAANRTHAVRYLWGAASERIQVGLVRIENAGHAEPSRRKRYPGFISRLVGRQNHDVEVAEAAWDFFRDKRAGPARR